ncbi:Amidohydrolase 3 [Alkaliphilus metalliredigens QYMF]|uniref:Amidohydrolase 3 n=1 Tax=Alkaliphilus metalliredigens (strain QYMF) TaxID=293826 RepID=A6TJB6_ALKMQ|nr:amidohydrolase family protein [Alkaliphilus metalliredigens]ABR46284.1 Amidohydrolase 3 [Alkaliphilus metalliredigens QYMF]
MYDLKIINGIIIDFDTGQKKVCDIGIKKGKIDAIGNCPEDAKREIDASGKIIAPGFIDIHMHEENLKEGGANPIDISNRMLLMGVTTCVAGNCGNNRQSLEEFIHFIHHKGMPVNYLSFIGHNFLRNAVGSTDRYQKASKNEVEEMQKLLINAVDQGALGVSFGLEYAPGIDLEEVLDLCSVIEDRKMLLAAHYRKDAKHSIPSIKEMMEISKQTGHPMQISHIGSSCAYGMMTEGLDTIQKGINLGLDITVDCYPYDAFSTYIGSAVFDEGCFGLWNKSYDAILLTEAPYKGMRCDEALFHKARKEHPDMLVVAFVMNEEEVIQAIKAPFVMVASDGLYRKGQGHPRGAGSFPRVLGKYVREKQELSLLEALKKMTLMPAKRLGLESKGEIKEGKDADIVIFDQNEILDGATFEDPQALPIGIDYVILKGEVAVENNIIIKGDLGKYISNPLEKTVQVNSLL